MRVGEERSDEAERREATEWSELSSEERPSLGCIGRLSRGAKRGHRAERYRAQERPSLGCIGRLNDC